MSPDELLNAYLDGELTGDEQARVEQRLAESADFRQLHEELRAVRSGLENLPQFRLGPDFAERVLRQAERAMLAVAAENDSQTPTALPPVAAAMQPVAARKNDDARAPSAKINPANRQIGWRIAAWAVASAAAIALMIVYQPAQEKPKNSVVALAPSDPATVPHSAPIDAVAADSVSGGDKSKTVLGRTPESSTTLKFKPADSRYAVDDALALDRDKDGRERELRDSAETYRADKFRPDTYRAVQPSVQRFNESLAEKSPPDEPTNDFGLAKDSPAAAAALPHAPSPVVPMPAAPPVPVEAGKQLAGEFRARIPANENTNGLLIVHVDVTPEAAESGALQQFLAANRRGLKRSEAQFGDLNGGGNLKDSPPEGANKSDDNKSNDNKSDDGENTVRLRVLGGVAAGDFDAVEIAADRSQLEATLDRLQADRVHVLNISIEPAPGAIAQSALFAPNEAAEQPASLGGVNAPTIAAPKPRAFTKGMPLADGKGANAQPEALEQPAGSSGVGAGFGGGTGGASMAKKGAAGPITFAAPAVTELESAKADLAKGEPAKPATATENTIALPAPATKNPAAKDASDKDKKGKGDAKDEEGSRRAKSPSPPPAAASPDPKQGVRKDAALDAGTLGAKPGDTYHALFLFRVVSPPSAAVVPAGLPATPPPVKK